MISSTTPFVRRSLQPSIKRKSIGSFLMLCSALCVPLLGSATSVQAATTFGGSFISTNPTCREENFCTGLETSRFSFGEPADAQSFQTSLEFIPNTFTERPSGEFLIGTLKITNGVVAIDSILSQPGTNTAYIDLSLRAFTDGVSSPNDRGIFRLAYNSTTNDDPDLRSLANADQVFFPDFPEYGVVNILEGNTADSTTYNVGILARFGSIVPAGFQALPGSSTSGNGAITDVPTPALLPGLAGMVLGAWRKRRINGVVVANQ
jgi:hypothetical protein